MRFLEMLMALVLSHLIGMCSYLNPKSSKVCFIHKTCAQQLPAATYSASAIDKTTEFCFLLAQETKDFSRKSQVPLVFFLSNLQSSKSISG